MIVRLHGKSYTGHRLVLNRKIGDTNSWPEVFVLYQDGNLRLKPQPPIGRNDVCFGSSVIVGPVDAEATERPYTDISEVQFSPENLCFDISYRSGGTAIQCLTVNRSEATLRVEPSYSAKKPFAAFRSMWVRDGNADVDTIQTFDGAGYPIISGWANLLGPAWRFSHKTVSTHNTSAPDIEMKVGKGTFFQ